MIKRINKITALLVAVATVISTMPVMASEQIERLNESDGEITNAVAYKDGKYLYEGSKSDAEYGVYYNDGSKDIKLDNVSDLDEYTKYGDSSVVVTSGNDEQWVNLTDGVVNNEKNRDDALVEAKTKLKTKLAKTNKYGSGTEIKSFNEVSNNKFGDGVWYEYTATGNESYYKDINDEVAPTPDPEASPDPELTPGEEPVSQITVKINFFWDSFTLAGETFSLGGNDYAGLAATINSTEFTGYKVQSAKVIGESVVAVFTTTEELGGIVPDGFVDPNLYNWGVGNADVPIASAWVPLTNVNVEPKSKISVKINFFWAGFTLAGQTFNLGQNDYAGLAATIKSTDFTGYKVQSADVVNDAVVAVFTTTEELGGIVPDGFVDPQLYNWGVGNADMPIASAWDPLTDGSIEPTEPIVPDIPTDSKKVLYYGYTDGKGNYIDCSTIANISVYNGKNVVKIDEFNDKKVKDDKTVKLGLPTLNKTLGQDENYIYNLIEVPVTGYQDLNKVKQDDDTVTNLTYVQKISKAQNNKDGGAYLPAKVESYLSGDYGWNGGDNWSYTAASYMLNDPNHDEDRQIRIVDGNIYVAHETTNDDNELEVTFGKLKLKKSGRITPVDSDTLGKRSEIAQPIVLEDFANNTKLGDDSSDTESGSWTMDANGNAWVIYNGRIKKSAQGNEFQNMYRSGMMNRISVYDDNNLIAWDNGGETYVTVKDGEIAEKTVIKTGWRKAEDRTWRLYDLKGNLVKGWSNFSSGWYYMNDEGIMQTGWINDSGKWYYLADSGAMKTGWIKVDEKWYYLDPSGARQENTTVNGYVLNSDGVWIN